MRQYWDVCMYLCGTQNVYPACVVVALNKHVLSHSITVTTRVGDLHCTLSVWSQTHIPSIGRCVCVCIFKNFVYATNQRAFVLYECVSVSVRNSNFIYSKKNKRQRLRQQHPFDECAPFSRRVHFYRRICHPLPFLCVYVCIRTSSECCVLIRCVNATKTYWTESFQFESVCDHMYCESREHTHTHKNAVHTS